MSDSIELELPGEGQPITMSDNAARQISKILSGEEPGVMLRVAVTGGGCSGFQYAFTFDDEKQDTDLVLERNGASVVIDDISQMYLGGSQIDYVDDLIGASFKINNPNASANCGCGTSFSI